MPGKRQNKSRKSKKTRRGGPQKTSRLTGFESAPTFFPDRRRGTFVYSTEGWLDCPIGSVGSQVFRLNSLYDPDFAVGGASVRSFAQASTLWNKYRVFSARVMISFTPVANGPTSVGVAGMVVASPLNTLGVDPIFWMGQRHVKRAELFQGNGIKLNFNVPIASIYAVRPSQVADEDDFAGLMSGNPNNVVYLHLGGDNRNAVAVRLYYSMRILYDAQVELPLGLA